MSRAKIGYAARTAADYFTDLPADRIDQEFPSFKPNRPCCVGAHLARLFCEHAFQTDYREGMEAWGQAVGGNRAHGILLLRNAGAGHDPFGTERWHWPPAEVFRRVAAVETLPDLRHANLRSMRLAGADLSGADFAGADLRRADLSFSNLTGTKLVGTNLAFAQLEKATLTDADLSGADLSGADLRHAIWHNVRLTMGLTVSMRNGGVTWPHEQA